MDDKTTARAESYSQSYASPPLYITCSTVLTQLQFDTGFADEFRLRTLAGMPPPALVKPAVLSPPCRWCAAGLSGYLLAAIVLCHFAIKHTAQKNRG